MNDSFYVCLTTIQPPTEEVRKLNAAVRQQGGHLVVAGDRKGPAEWPLQDCDFLSLEGQKESGFELTRGLPENHYTRKNIAYLQAIRSGATCIYETDDDNAPMEHWVLRSQNVSKARKIESVSACQPFSKCSEDPDSSGSLSGFPSQWINVYRYFTNDKSIWPRGLPLVEVQNDLSACQPFSKRSEDPDSSGSLSDAPLQAPIQQGLVNGSPDVDAIWRLTQDRPFDFDQEDSLWLAPGQWCPFNTQSTWWFPIAYPLLYIPSYCSFRMCDIWKSFVAQRCLWAMGFGIVFHAPEVVQKRNEHNLMKDFEDEVPGYLNNARIADVLSKLSLSGVPAVDMQTCYSALVVEGFFPETELTLLDRWLVDIRNIVN